MSTPLVSVIVPVYNTGKRLMMQVDSILSQTLRDFELLLIDDGSTDGTTPKLCDDYAARDPRVKVLHKQNGGVSESRNHGLAHARGSFITFADHDDYMFPDNLQTMVEEAQSLGGGKAYDLVICQFIRCKREKIHTYHEPRGKTKEVVARSKDEMYYAVNNMGYKNFVIWNQLFKRSIIEAHNIRFVMENSEDEMFATEYFTHIYTLKSIDYKGYIFIYNEGSLGSSHNYIPSYSWIKRIEPLYENIIQKYHPSQYTYNWRIANRLATLCVKGYYKDSYLPWKERMNVWNTVRKDKWLNDRITLSKMSRGIRLVLTIAKARLYYLLDPIFLIYGKLNS